LLMVVVGLYFLLRDDSDSTSVTKPPQQSVVPPSPTQKPATASAPLQTFIVDVAEGRAEVYRNGELVGMTPYQFLTKAGEPQVDLVLKREGYLDKSVRLSTSDTKKTYTFMLEKKY